MIRRYTLSNGVRVVTDQIRDFRSVAVGLWFDTGSVNENEKINGISHFIEHMLFKGTEKRSALEIAAALEDVGGQMNAFTGKEFTAYYAKVLTEHLPIAADVLSDLTFNSVFDPEELKREGEVICEEIKMYEDSPHELCMDLFSQAAWPQHQIGKPVIGHEEIIRNLQRDDLIGYWKHHYTPENLVVSVAGGFDEKELRQELEKRFGSIQGAAMEKNLQEPLYLPKPIVREKDIEQTHLCIGVKGTSGLEEKRYALSLLSTLLGGGMTSYLFQEIREKRGLVYTVSSFESLYRNTGLLGVYAGTSPKNLPEVVRLIMEGLNHTKSGGFTEKQLDSSKEQIKGSLLMGLESSQRRMNHNAKMEFYFDGKLSIDQIIDSINKVTLKEIESLAKDLFVTEKLTYSLVGPMQELPSNVELVC